MATAVADAISLAVTFALLTPVCVLFCYSSWCLCDAVVQKTFGGYALLAALSIAFHICFSFFQAKIVRSCSGVRGVAVAYNLLSAWSNVAHARFVAEVVLSVCGAGAAFAWWLVSAFVTLQSTRSLRNVLAPPIAVRRDLARQWQNVELSATATAFRTEADESVYSLLDSVASVFIVHTSVYVFWVSSWLLVDALVVFYGDGGVCSDVVMLSASTVVCAALLRRQKTFVYLAEATRTNYGRMSELALLDGVHALASIFVVAYWHALCNLIDVLWPLLAFRVLDYDLTCPVINVISFFFVAAAGATRSLTLRGLECDLRPLCQGDVLFPTDFGSVLDDSAIGDSKHKTREESTGYNSSAQSGNDNEIGSRQRRPELAGYKNSPALKRNRRHSPVVLRSDQFHADERGVIQRNVLPIQQKENTNILKGAEESMTEDKGKMAVEHKTVEETILRAAKKSTAAQKKAVSESKTVDTADGADKRSFNGEIQGGTGVMRKSSVGNGKFFEKRSPDERKDVGASRINEQAITTPVTQLSCSYLITDNSLLMPMDSWVQKQRPQSWRTSAVASDASEEPSAAFGSLGDEPEAEFLEWELRQVRKMQGRPESELNEIATPNSEAVATAKAVTRYGARRDDGEQMVISTHSVKGNDDVDEPPILRIQLPRRHAAGCSTRYADTDSTRSVPANATSRNSDSGGFSLDALPTFPDEGCSDSDSRSDRSVDRVNAWYTALDPDCVEDVENFRPTEPFRYRTQRTPSFKREKSRTSQEKRLSYVSPYSAPPSVNVIHVGRDETLPSHLLDDAQDLSERRDAPQVRSYSIFRPRRRRDRINEEIYDPHWRSAKRRPPAEPPLQTEIVFTAAHSRQRHLSVINEGLDHSGNSRKVVRVPRNSVIDPLAATGASNYLQTNNGDFR